MTGPVITSIDFDGDVDGDLTLGTPVVTPQVTVGPELDQIEMAVACHARLTVTAPTVPLAGLNRRVSPGVSVAMPNPTLAGARPRTPRFLGTMDSSVTVRQGAGHIRSFPDPDPVWSGSSWTNPPPSAPVGANFTRWTARTLPDPAGFPGHSYKLGDPSAVDGTSGIVSGARQWAAAPGSDLSPAWRSAYPWKPTVKNHIHYGPDGSLVTVAAGVHLSPHYVEHMWADMGTILTPPFTVLLVAVITDVPVPRYRHYLLDSGRSPVDYVSLATRAKWLSNGVVGDTTLPENFGYRTALNVAHYQMRGYNDVAPTTRLGKVPFAHTFKPKMFFGIFNGSQSYFGNYSTAGKQIRKVGLVSHGAQRFLIMGRANSLISSRAASAVVAFEIRTWDKALSTDNLESQYNQLASTWRFHEYH